MFSRGPVVRLLSWVTLLVAALVASPATAAPVAVRTCVLRAVPGLQPRALFAQADRFDCRTPQHHLGGGDFWVLSSAFPPGVAALDEIVVASAWQKRVAVHILYADGQIRTVRYTSRTTGAHLRLGAMIHVAIPHRAAPPVRLLWHFEGATNLRGIVIGATLIDHAEGVRREVVLAWLYGGFAGMAIAMLVCNLALWAALRQSFQPAFCLLILCIVCYAATSSGALGEWWPDLDNNDRLRLNDLLIGASGAAVVCFARAFFERVVFAGWLGRVSTAVSIGVFGSGATYALLAPWHARLLDDLVSGSFVVLMLLVPMIVWRAWRVHSDYLW
ncbi:MAG: 7TM-DISM domain-containing protein, partial [Pseudomonadota bacterium]|nr:7TM-DISM domain-containing protein [Pseudomonadota bacterium]